MPIETFSVSGEIQVESDGMPDVTPWYEQTVAAGESVSYAITDLDDDQAYRVTLVVSGNVTWDALDAIFVDADASGTADAGASEEVALITTVNGEAITGAKTWPAGDDDPASPSAIFPIDGMIVVEVEGQGAGSIVPVAYANGGASTFLEVDALGMPVEAYGVGGLLIVTD